MEMLDDRIKVGFYFTATCGFLVFVNAPVWIRRHYTCLINAKCGMNKHPTIFDPGGKRLFFPRDWNLSETQLPISIEYFVVQQ